MNRLDGWELSAFCLGLCGIIVLLYVAIKHDKPKPTMQEGITVFLTTSSFSPGLKICWYAATNQFAQESNLDRFYIFCGGFAVIWLAVESVNDILRSVPKKLETPLTNDQKTPVSQSSAPSLNPVLGVTSNDPAITPTDQPSTNQV